MNALGTSFPALPDAGTYCTFLFDSPLRPRPLDPGRLGGIMTSTAGMSPETSHDQHPDLSTRAPMAS